MFFRSKYIYIYIKQDQALILAFIFISSNSHCRHLNHFEELMHETFMCFSSPFSFDNSKKSLQSCNYIGNKGKFSEIYYDNGCITQKPFEKTHFHCEMRSQTFVPVSEFTMEKSLNSILFLFIDSILGVRNHTRFSFFAGVWRLHSIFILFETKGTLHFSPDLFVDRLFVFLDFYSGKKMVESEKKGWVDIFLCECKLLDVCSTGNEVWLGFGFRSCVHCVFFVYTFYTIPVFSEMLPNGLDFRHLTFSAYRTIFNPFPSSVHHISFSCGKAEMCTLFESVVNKQKSIVRW